MLSIAPQYLIPGGGGLMSVGTSDRVTHQDERALLAEVRLLFGAVDPWLADFMRAATAARPLTTPPHRRSS